MTERQQLPGMALTPSQVASVRSLRHDFSRLLMEHRFVIDELLTKISILREESLHMHSYNPIEHIASRVKSPRSLLEKVNRRQLPLDIKAIRTQITDIAGIRITCSFIADTYHVLDMLTSQDDVRVVEIKDYIAHPKPNGYKSLHAILEVPVFLRSGSTAVICEVQIRTIAMDFWASLEHKIHYKFAGEVPDRLIEELTQTAEVANQLDRRMEQLHAEVHDGEEPHRTDENFDEEALRILWDLSTRQE
ncbi:MAG: GTP pyrophosphokinase family protein [Brevibacterium sp.]|uniref:GTP pyrophosphokinase n=1 Tax=Brevibacterium sp. TaxID=1701 RepID=UPI0026494050|nr:GTP pyrophosphokinase family protein [Brevibacterium sp.]MDN5806342.1 GTP pyrophosphokinase family protein [Brevibacterium sp.]MDN5833260.1 GTP pyrophosphokinase family protein [Brevibacterium sp.]MDN5876103.1 GTP pyrophosphokinase family protein [Brevibacterium sp.]MDN5909951.1 GTP pyrophosphokinase family protein [Brevibacterium sp.]MDN6132498.1 GTP pyrophosphokinase family protein [Brevibacterium sp.]